MKPTVQADSKCDQSQLSVIKDYYGKVLESKKDLKTTACCATEAPPRSLGEVIAKIHPEVSRKFYGCGVPFPALLNGLTVLDLGSGSGRDCFALSALVGPEGRVIGVDMTDEQIAVAKKHVDYHTKIFDLPESNVEFRQGYIEDLSSVDIQDQSIDLVISNCVINLSPDKKRVFSEIKRVLKPGGELYFSDVFVDRRLTPEQMNDGVLLGECLGGALYTEDFRRILAEMHWHDARLVSGRELEITNGDVKDKIGLAKFFSMTYRLFHLELEDRCEDYGQAVRYMGTIPELPHGYLLDQHHFFATGGYQSVCANTAAMIQQSRYGKHFEVVGDLSNHYGLFDCGPSEFSSPSQSSGSCC